MTASRAQIDWKADARRIVLEKFLAAAARIEKKFREKHKNTTSLANAVANEDTLLADVLYALEEARERGLDAPPAAPPAERR
jgi:hypothetical protein